MSLYRPSISQRLVCLATTAMMVMALCAAPARAGKEVFQRTKPHVNVGAISKPRATKAGTSTPRAGRIPAAAAHKRDLPLTIGLPDLRIRAFQFVPGHVKKVRVHVVNTGVSAAGHNRLQLTVRRINGVPVGRMKHAVVAPLAAGKDTWIVIDADSILPSNVKLEATTFRLDVDATKDVNEANESNNLEWHNL